MDTILTISFFTTPLSALVFLAGLVSIMNNKDEKDRKIGINLMIYSSIVFIIGMGVCLY